MAKRKSTAKPAVPNKKRVGNLDSTDFCCPSCCCHSDGNVRCEMDMMEMQGRAVCKDCEATFTMKITTATKPIDIYTEWCNECIKDFYFSDNIEDK